MDFLKPEDRVRQLGSLSAGPSTSSGLSLLVLRGNEDEAGLGLAFGSIQLLLTSLLGRWVQTLGLAVFFGLVTVYRFWTPRDPMAILTALLYLLWGASSLIAVLFLLESLAGAVFGRELFGGNLYFRMNVNSAPDFFGDITIRTLMGQTIDSSPTPRVRTRPGQPTA